MLENIAIVEINLANTPAIEMMMALPDYTLYGNGHFYLKNNQTNILIQFDCFGRIPFTPELVKRWVGELHEIYPFF